MRLRTANLAVGLVALALVAGACSRNGTITVNGEKANDHGTKTVSGSSFELEADNDGTQFYFNPTVLKGKPGQKETLEIKNEGNTKHNFTVESQHVDQDIQPDQTARVTITFPTSGIVEFHCEYHKSLGMVGELQAAS